MSILVGTYYFQDLHYNITTVLQPIRVFTVQLSA